MSNLITRPATATPADAIAGTQVAHDQRTTARPIDAIGGVAALPPVEPTAEPDAPPGAMSALQRWTLAAVCLATAILMLDIAVVNSALTSIAGSLDTGLTGVQWVVDAYTLALASVVLTAGSLADRFGRRRLFVAGTGLFTAASIACAAASSIEMLSASRAVQGIGAAVMFAVSLALLADAFPSERQRAGALAIYGATIGASFAIGPFVGGALTEGLSWRWIFLINVPIGLLCLAITVSRLRESRDPHPRRVDLPGQVFLTAGLFTLVLGLLRGNEQGWGSTSIVLLLGAAGASLAAFVAWELRAREPMFPLGMLRDPAFAGAQIAAFSISASLFAVFIYATLYLQQVLGLSPMEAGLFWVPATLVNLFAAGATASLVDRIGAGRLMAIGLALVATGLALMTGPGADASWEALLPASIIAMLGTGLFNPAVIAVALDVPQERSGLAAGINDTARQAGIAVGVAALGALIPASAGLGAADPTGFVDGLHDAYWVGAAVAATGAVASLALIRRKAA
ncbi:MAG: MFS transporter [Solirubrobacteraceae bacterium]|nr:MFS transporter [Solirubrobacteraceae bacterium]